ncbi:MAG: small multi-drug export protein, partial [archaeon]
LKTKEGSFAFCLKVWLDWVIFIWIPLPGNGVWAGALAAYLPGMRFRHFAIACTIGVLIAVTIVVLVVLGFLNGIAI